MSLNNTEQFELLDQALNQNWAAWQPTFGANDKKWLSESTLKSIQSQLAPAIKLEAPPLQVVSSEPPAGMKLRKWQQIKHFKDCFNSNADSVVDWCCGMGHLSRYLARNEQSVVGLEIDSILVAKAISHNAPSATFHQCDVLHEPRQYLSLGQSFVALHACGSLHTSLVENSVESNASDLHLAPCCYHKRFKQGLKMLSQPARQSPLELNERNIQLAVRQTVTAPQREQLAREKLRLYRLGFDEWVKRTLGIEHYTHLPSISPAATTQGFSAFCQWGAKQRVPELVGIRVKDESRLLSRAEQRLELEVSYEAQCDIFRRALEIRLCLDNVLFLEEHGFQAELIEFCSPSITPRNIMIRAFKG